MEPRPGRVPLETTTPAPPAAPSEPEAAVPPGPPLPPEEQERISEAAVAAIQTCYDPEIPVNIHELGLIYGIEVAPTGLVTVRMTLTSPACPAAASLPAEVQAKVKAVPGVTAAKVDVVWEPTWTPDRMSEAARLQLGFFD